MHNVETNKLFLFQIDVAILIFSLIKEY